jgi:hypothetical protein
MPATTAEGGPASKSPDWLLEFRADVFSQNGEDGVLQQALAVLPAAGLDRWCVEFGAWDGVHLSNSRNLILNHGYRAVLIEGDARKFRELQANYAGSQGVIPVHGLVGFGAADGLDAMLADTEVPEDFDVLSIDIDGNDYHVWKAMRRLRPKLVCIEFNQTIHTDVDFVQPADPNVSQGSSLSALVRLGREKGYELICVLPWNAVFVRAEYFHRFHIADNSPYTLRKDTQYVTYLSCGFDGEIFLHGCQQMPWHGTRLDASRMQQLPRWLHRYPGRYNTLQRILFKLHRTLRPGAA